MRDQNNKKLECNSLQPGEMKPDISDDDDDDFIDHDMKLLDSEYEDEEEEEEEKRPQKITKFRKQNKKKFKITSSNAGKQLNDELEDELESDEKSIDKRSSTANELNLSNKQTIKNRKEKMEINVKGLPKEKKIIKKNYDDEEEVIEDYAEDEERINKKNKNYSTKSNSKISKNLVAKNIVNIKEKRYNFDKYIPEAVEIIQRKVNEMHIPLDKEKYKIVSVNKRVIAFCSYFGPNIHMLDDLLRKLKLFFMFQNFPHDKEHFIHKIIYVFCDDEKFGVFRDYKDIFKQYILFNGSAYTTVCIKEKIQINKIYEKFMKGSFNINDYPLLADTTQKFILNATSNTTWGFYIYDNFKSFFCKVK